MTRVTDALAEVPLLGILRRCPVRHVVDVAEAVCVAGLRVVEVTMDSADAGTQIRSLREALDGRAVVGAGTVTSAESLQEAVAAGAEFLVAPDLQPALVEQGVALGVPFIPGSLTPTEIATADRLGAAMVKVFPAGPMGPGYVKALRGPMPHVGLLCTGGITPELAGALLEAGADACGVGSDVFAPELLESGDSATISKRVTAYLRRAAEARAASGR